MLKNRIGRLLNDARLVCNLRKFCSKGDGNKHSESDTSSQGRYVSRRVLSRQKQRSNGPTTSIEKPTGSNFAPNDRKMKMRDMLDEMVIGVEGQQDMEEFPSDIEEKQEMKRKQMEVVRPKIDPESTSIALFPGQGSQFVGMGKHLLTFPGVKELYDHASEILKYDLLKLCLYGPQSELNKTVHCQPAVFVTSVAAIEKMKEENFKGIESTVAAAGFSVGEFAAMVFAEIMSFEDALKIVSIRAKEMQKASEATPSGMMTVFCFWGTELKIATQAAKEYCKTKHNIENPVCVVANYLFQETKVIAGHEEALDFIAENYKDFGIRKVKRIPVSGAFHTELMQSARKPVRDALKNIEIQKPKFKVYSDLTTKPISNNVNFNKNLVNQIVKPVKWEQIMYKLYMRDKDARHPYTYECGPGNQLGIFLQKLNNKAYTNYRQIEV